MWLILGIITSVLAVLLHQLWIKPRKYWADRGIPYITPLPLVGNFGSNLIGKAALPLLLNDLYSTFPDKRYVGIHQATIPVLLIREPELIKQITVKEFNHFPQHNPFIEENADPLWANGLFAMKGGERWRGIRSTLSPSFTSSKLKIMFGLMKECAQQFTKHLEKQGGTLTVEMKDAFTRVTNDVIATTAFGITCDSFNNPENEFYLMGKHITNFSGIRGLKMLLGAVSPILGKLFQACIFPSDAVIFLRGLIKEAIRVREENGVVRPDMIHLLMEAKRGRLKKDEHEVADSGFAVVQEMETDFSQTKQKPQITDDDIVSQAAIFFVAGFDTVSILMCFSSYELALNPDIQEKLFQEISKTIEDNKGEIPYEALLGIKYLDMVVTETLRKWPPTMITDRMCVKEFIIAPEPGENEVKFEVGMGCLIPIYSLHRDPKYYPDPDKFDPERFSEASKHTIKPYTFLPFGAGPKSCIGSRLALLECKLVLAELLRKFEIITVPKTEIPLKLSSTSAVPSTDAGFWLGLKPRQ